MACLLKNEPVSCSMWPVKQLALRSQSESKSEQGAYGRMEQTRSRVSYPWPG
jgi:hypothetical protein